MMQVNEKIVSVGARIKEIRMDKKVSQRSLAQKIGISQSNLSNIECGRIYATLENLFKISTVLGCPIHDFFIYAEPAETKKEGVDGITLVDLFAAIAELKKMKNTTANNTLLKSIH